MTDGRSRGSGEGAEAHGECQRVDPVPLVQEVGLEHLGGELGFELADPLVDPLDLDAHRLGRRRPGAQVVPLVRVDRHRERPDGFGIQEEGRRGIGRELRVSLEAPAGERREDGVLRRIEVPEIAAGGAGGELVLLEQGDRRAPTGELERARRPDDPAAHDHDVWHAGRLPAEPFRRIVLGDVAEWPKAAAC